MVGGIPIPARVALEGAEDRLTEIARRSPHGGEIAQLGAEGEAAQVYFSIFDHLILVEDRASLVPDLMEELRPSSALLD